jgi:hypothetical protein
MAVTLIFSCGHGLALIDANDSVPESGPWALWPNPDIELGDRMTCVVEGETSTVVEIRSGVVPMGGNGWEIV